MVTETARPEPAEVPLKPEATDEQLTRLEMDIAQTLAALNLERRGKNRPERVKEYTDALDSFKARAVKLDLGKPKRATLDMLKGMVREHGEAVLSATVEAAVGAVGKANVSMSDLTSEDDQFTVTASAKCILGPDGKVTIGKSQFRIGPTVKRKAK